MTTIVTKTAPRTEAEGQHRLTFARAALALAGHEVTDPYLIDLHEQMARGEITPEDVRRLTVERFIK